MNPWSCPPLTYLLTYLPVLAEIASLNFPSFRTDSHLIRHCTISTNVRSADMHQCIYPFVKTILTECNFPNADYIINAERGAFASASNGADELIRAMQCTLDASYNPIRISEHLCIAYPHCFQYPLLFQIHSTGNAVLAEL